jgi:hypothetical protein
MRQRHPPSIAARRDRAWGVSAACDDCNGNGLSLCIVQPIPGEGRSLPRLQRGIPPGYLTLGPSFVDGRGGGCARLFKRRGSAGFTHGRPALSTWRKGLWRLCGRSRAALWAGVACGCGEAERRAALVGMESPLGSTRAVPDVSVVAVVVASVEGLRGRISRGASSA